ncbi:MAG TPA: hypothetical protein VEL80_05535 [Burkholderiales bacterium]|nr:hypothetical protein [Burkholderiales bacterium]
MTDRIPVTVLIGYLGAGNGRIEFSGSVSVETPPIFRDCILEAGLKRMLAGCDLFGAFFGLSFQSSS